jgi:hypothetical protein
VQNLGLLLEVGLQDDLVGLLLSLTEYDRPPMPASIATHYIRNRTIAGMVGAVDGQVLDGL